MASMESISNSLVYMGTLTVLTDTNIESWGDARKTFVFTFLIEKCKIQTLLRNLTEYVGLNK